MLHRSLFPEIGLVKKQLYQIVALKWVYDRPLYEEDKHLLSQLTGSNRERDISCNTVYLLCCVDVHLSLLFILMISCICWCVTFLKMCCIIWFPLRRAEEPLGHWSHRHEQRGAMAESWRRIQRWFMCLSFPICSSLSHCLLRWPSEN